MSIIRVGTRSRPGRPTRVGPTRGGSTAGSGGFDPADYGTVHTWLDPTNGVSLSGTDVTAWADSSGNGHDFTYAAGTVEQTSTLNGLDVISLDVGYLASDEASSVWKFLHDGTEYHIFLVVKPGVVANPNTFYGILGTNNADSGNVGFYIDYDDRSSKGFNDRVQHSISTGGGSSQFAANNLSANDAFPANTWQIVDVGADPDNGTAADRSVIKVNDGTAIQNSSASWTPSTSDPNTTLAVGSMGTLYRLVGGLGDVIIMTAVTDRAGLVAALQSRWGL